MDGHGQHGLEGREPLIPKHGGYRKLKSFQLAQLVYDVTVRFCDRYIDRRSRTHDQMVQAARSGVQNIAEGSVEELRLDYESFLRQRGLPQWEPSHPALERFKARRCTTLKQVRQWAQDEHGQPPTNTDTDAAAESVRGRPCGSVPYAVLVSNAALSLLNVCCHLLGRQVAAQAAAFEKEGGFTERLYRTRHARRQRE